MLEHVYRVRSQGEPDMAADGYDRDFSGRLVAAFEAHVQLPLMGHVGSAPAEVKALIETFRNRLTALESLVPGQVAARSNGTGGGHALSTEPALAAGGDADDIGRNQRSRVRELVLLEALEAEHHALSLPQLSRALTDAGFDDTSAAVVSQLHRLKKNDIISQPANGMYALTQAGVLHVRDLRRNFGHLRLR